MINGVCSTVKYWPRVAVLNCASDVVDVMFVTRSILGGLVVLFV